VRQALSPGAAADPFDVALCALGAVVAGAVVAGDVAVSVAAAFPGAWVSGVGVLVPDVVSGVVGS
jgi:hypothetical protein